MCEAKVMRQMRHANLLPLLSTVLDRDHLWVSVCARSNCTTSLRTWSSCLSAGEEI